MQCELVSRNVTVHGKRTSLRLERATWAALDDICIRENRTVHDLCSAVDHHKDSTSRTACVRAFVVTYFHQRTIAVIGSARRSASNDDAQLPVLEAALQSLTA